MRKMAQHLKCNTILEGTSLLNKKVLALATASTLSTGVFVETSTVKASESLWSSAQQYDVRIDKLKNNDRFELDSVFPNRQVEILNKEQGDNIYETNILCYG